MYYFIQAAFITVFFSSIPANLFSQIDSIAKPDSVLLKQIEQQIKSSEPPLPPAQVRTAPSTLPDISVIGDFQASYKIMLKEILMPESMKRSFLFNQLWILMPEPISFLL